MEIYFDNAASSPVCAAAAEEAAGVIKNIYANPSSGHAPGREAARLLRQAARSVSELISSPEENGGIIFTSGGTESNSLAIFGTAKRPGTRIITSRAEHPSVLDSFKVLAERGFDVVYLNPDGEGRISPADLSGAINDKTVLVSLMHINHETGVISDTALFARTIKEKNRNVIFHVDAVQSLGKHEINVRKWQADLLSVSAHKLHGLKGTGALYVRGGLAGALRPLFYGGGQQNALRPGTENLPGICAFGAAVREAAANMRGDMEKIRAIKNEILKIPQIIDCAVINGAPEESSPYITNISFPGIPSEVMQNALDSRGIYVSAGAACNTRKKSAQNVPAAYGLNRGYADSAIRISLGRQNTMAEVHLFIATLSDIIGKLKK